MKEPQLDIIVITHGRLDLTMRCMNALYSHTQTPFHLIVIDDSDDLTPLYFDSLRKTYDNITYIHSDVPYKTGNQIFNIGFKHCKTPYVATVMNSMRVEPDWEVVGLELMKKNPLIGIIGFKCLFPDNRIESAGIKMQKWLPCDVGRDMPSHRLSVVGECDAVQWAFALLRLEAVKDTLEDDVFHGFKGWDDIDNCFCVKKKGWKIIYDGLGVGYHEPRSTRGDNSNDAMIKNKENGLTFYKRWGFYDEFIKAHPDGAVHQGPQGVEVSVR